MSLQIIITGDGSHSLRNSELDETYHSSLGAIQESKHVFIESGLKYVLKRMISEIKILEIGFGTGLNAFLTLLYQDKVRISYSGIETFPLPSSIYEKLNYYKQLKQEKELFLKLHQFEWNEVGSITSHFSLQKLNQTFETVKIPATFYDLVYFDAFAPGKQPEIWELPVIQNVKHAMKPGAVLVTYCAQGQFKRNLRSLGFKVEELPGPPGKFEMVRAINP